MRNSSHCTAGVGLAISLAVLTPPQAAAARPAKLGLGDVPVLLKQLRSPDRGTRRKALSQLVSSISSKPETVRALAPELRRLAVGDPVCRVRMEALRALVWRRGDVNNTPVKAILHALQDTCPIANANGADYVEHVGKARRREVVRRLLHLAENSPFYYVQCRALIALGALRAERARKLMARALAVGAETGMLGGGVSYQATPRTLPQCAVWALMKLHGKPVDLTREAARKRREVLWKKLQSKLPLKQRKQLMQDWALATMKMVTGRSKPPTVKQVRHWRDRLSKRGLVTRSPPALCLEPDVCPLGQTCLAMACTPHARALRIYRAYRQAHPATPRKRTRAWRNAEDPHAVRLGLGLGVVAWLSRLVRGTQTPGASPGAGPRVSRRRELQNRAKRLWLGGRCQEALKLAREAYKLRASGFMAAIIGMCACSLKHTRLAHWAHRRLRGGQRKMLADACRRKGVNLP
ncbi:MAG: hypothetical protein ABI333_10540 [bacterium]